MSETRWLWWFIWTAAACFFCLSWQRVRGASLNSGAIGNVVFSTPGWILDLPLADQSRCRRLAMYQLAITNQATVSAETEAARITAEDDSVLASWLVLPDCDPETNIRWIITRDSTFAEKPLVLARVGGVVGANLAAADANLDLFLSSGREPIELRFLLPSAGDTVRLGSAQTSPWLTTIGLDLVDLDSWGDVLTALLPTSTESVGFEYRISSGSQPTPTQTKPLADCLAMADLFFTQPSSRCWQLPGQQRYWPVRALTGQNLFALYPNDTLTPLSLPPAVKPTQAGEVVISEVMWAGSFNGEQSVSNDEWLELANPTNQRFNLRGAKIEHAVMGGNTLLINVELVIEPYGYVVIGRLAGNKTQLARDADWVTSSLSLNNDQAELVLRAQNGVELDHTPAGSWQAGRNDAVLQKRAAAQRLHLNLPGDDWSNWSTCAIDSPACLAVTRFWRSNLGQNQGTPWQPSVL